MNETAEKIPLVSVVIPVYNRAAIIARSLDSVLAQTFTDYEIIVVDDGSTDNVPSALDSYGASDIRFIRQENAGACAARNNGIRNARGEYVAFLDSDDTWDPNYLEKVAGVFRSDRAIGFVWTRSRFVYLPGGRREPRKARRLSGFVYKKVLRQGYLTSCSFITARKSLLLDIGGYDEALKASQDDDICFNLAKHTKTGMVDEALGSLFIDTSIERISNNNERKADAWLALWDKYAGDIVKLCGKHELAKKYLSVYKQYKGIHNQEKSAAVYAKIHALLGRRWVLFEKLYTAAKTAYRFFFRRKAQ